MGHDLTGIIRVRRYALDEKRRALAELQEQEDKIIAHLKALEEELQREKEAAAAAPSMSFTYGAYVDAYIDKREHNERILSQLRQKIDAARDEIAEAFRELKTFEITQEEREKREAEEIDRKEQIVLDEIGTTLHRRRGLQAEEEAERLARRPVFHPAAPEEE